ncbi:MAG: ATP synthase F1 subunit delta [Coriobacteriia bacterium]|nr:ATP synthase F1 subunit delta [Coriobacteriia bacterium]
MRISRTLGKQIVGTYANALFDAAASEGVVDEVHMQLDAVVRLVRSSAPLRDAVLDAAVPAAKRAATVRGVFSGLKSAVVDTLVIMAERGNFDLLSRVTEEYGRVAEEKRGIVAVDVTTAVALSEALRESIINKFAADLGKGVVLREKVDPAIIGGIIFDAHGQRIDASIASQLESARQVLSTAHTGGEA